MSGTARPTENDTPLDINPDAVKSTQVSTKGLQTVTRWRSQVAHIVRCVEDIQFVQCVSDNVLRQAPNTGSRPAVKQIRCGTVAKKDTIMNSVSGISCNIRMGMCSTSGGHEMP